jgi:hypothetical protein
MPRTEASRDALVVEPEPRFELSPYLYMQFMEPLGAANGSTDIAWDYGRDEWREGFVELASALGPRLMRWPGGCFSSYYRWREGVGQRRPTRNLLWGGMESNRIGTHEYIDFCRRVGADPMIAVNFESDGREHWAHPPEGGERSAGPDEAAAWVDYCNNPENAERIRHGAPDPFGVRLWQIGNETSYDENGYDCETTARRTVAFAEAMRRADPDIELVGWGDSGWAPRVLEVAGDHLQYVAFHHHFRSALDDSPLHDTAYREDPERTWEHFMSAWQSTDECLNRMRQQVAGWGGGLALTESHFSMRGRNRCEAQSTWAAGVANARVLNVHARHGDILKIATLGDFCGSKWMNNVLMLPGPWTCYMMPVGSVIALFRAHSGERALTVVDVPDGLDVTASRTGERVFLHVVNTRRTKAVEAEPSVPGRRIESARVWQIAADPELEVMETRPDVFTPTEHELPDDGQWAFPAASVSAVELELASQSP